MGLGLAPEKGAVHSMDEDLYACDDYLVWTPLEFWLETDDEC